MKLHPPLKLNPLHRYSFDTDSETAEKYLRFLGFFWASLLTAYLLSLWS